MEILDEKLLMEVIDEMMGTFPDDLPATYGMMIVGLIEDSIRLYHEKKLKKYTDEIDEYFNDKGIQ